MKLHLALLLLIISTTTRAEEIDKSNATLLNLTSTRSLLTQAANLPQVSLGPASSFGINSTVRFNKELNLLEGADQPRVGLKAYYHNENCTVYKGYSRSLDSVDKNDFYGIESLYLGHDGSFKMVVKDLYSAPYGLNVSCKGVTIDHTLHEIEKMLDDVLSFEDLHIASYDPNFKRAEVHPVVNHNYRREQGHLAELDVSISPLANSAVYFNERLFFTGEEYTSPADDNLLDVDRPVFARTEDCLVYLDSRRLKRISLSKGYLKAPFMQYFITNLTIEDHEFEMVVSTYQMDDHSFNDMIGEKIKIRCSNLSHPNPTFAEVEDKMNGLIRFKK